MSHHTHTIGERGNMQKWKATNRKRGATRGRTLQQASSAAQRRDDLRVCMRTRQQCHYQSVYQEVVFCSSSSVILHICEIKKTDVTAVIWPHWDTLPSIHCAKLSFCVHCSVLLNIDTFIQYYKCIKHDTLLLVTSTLSLRRNLKCRTFTWNWVFALVVLQLLIKGSADFFYLESIRYETAGLSISASSWRHRLTSELRNTDWEHVKILTSCAGEMSPRSSQCVQQSDQHTTERPTERRRKYEPTSVYSHASISVRGGHAKC